jgi:putative glutamine amidotransferase
MCTIIGIPASINELKDSSMLSTYAHAIESSGALPLLLPYVQKRDLIERFSSLCDGFFFTGGVDIEPARYGEEKKDTCEQTSPYRDELEFSLFDAVFATGKPILAICRGAQLINAALGGTLYQDLPTETDTTVAHRQTEEKFEFSHDIVIEKNSPLFSLFGKEIIRGNSFHHQAIKTLAEGLALTARAEDGIIEGFYHTSHPYLRAYQWHPERLFEKDSDAKLVFTDFINACKGKNKNGFFRKDIL